MRRKALMVVPVAVAIILTGCGSSSSGGKSNAGSGGGTPAATGTVTVFNAMEPAEAQALQKVVDNLINSKVKYKARIEQSADFEQQIKIRVQGGNPPEIAMYPQPGSVIEQAKSGKAIALEDLGFTASELEQTFGKYLVSLGEYNGKHYGLPTNVNLKSMVWYPKKAFDAKGYKVPTTWDEMLKLSDQIVKDGASPWCIGFGSGGATGWPGTDWIEDIMLRTAGPATYDKWVKHQIPFTDPSVKTAFQDFGKILFTPGYVLGGAKNIPQIQFGDAPLPMFKNPPKCYLHRQASFINAFFPKTAQAGVDYDWFTFPPIQQQGTLIAGELSTVFKDTPAVRDFLKRFITTEVQCAQGKETAMSRISPVLSVTSSCYANPQLAKAADVVNQGLKAGNARFDGSDQMPSAVGSGSFWTGMVKYVTQGPSSLDAILKSIDSSWPTSS